MSFIHKYGQMIVDDIDITSYLVLENVERSLQPEISTTRVTVPGRDGSEFRGIIKGSKQIKVYLRAIPDNLYDVKELQEIYDEILPFIVKNKTMKLELFDNPNRYEVVSNDSLVSLQRFLGTAQIELIYLNLLGVSFSKTTSNSLINVGNTPTPFILTGTYSGETSIVVRDAITKNVVAINPSSMTKGDKIYIDFGNELVRCNGKNAIQYLYVDSDFWWLDVGENRIGTYGLSDITYTHRARWM